MMDTLLSIDNELVWGVAVLATENKNFIESFENKRYQNKCLSSLFLDLEVTKHDREFYTISLPIFSRRL